MITCIFCNILLQWRSQDLEEGRRTAGRKSPSGVHGQTPWWRNRGQSHPKSWHFTDIWLPSHAYSNITFSATTHRAVFNVKMSVCTAFHITRFEEYFAKFNITVNLIFLTLGVIFRHLFWAEASTKRRKFPYDWPHGWSIQCLKPANKVEPIYDQRPSSGLKCGKDPYSNCGGRATRRTPTSPPKWPILCRVGR